MIHDVSMFVRKSLLLFFVLACPAILRAQSSVWEPEKTWFFAMGVIQFDDPNTTSCRDGGGWVQ